MTPSNASSLFLLNQVVSSGNAPTCKNPIELLESLCLNLSKNSRALRISTLKVMNFFDQQNFESSENSKIDSETIKQFYSGKCGILGLLLKAEELPLNFETEKVKANILRKVQIMLASELVP